MKVKLQEEETIKEEIKTVEQQDPQEQPAGEGGGIEQEVVPVHDKTEDLRLEIAELRGRLSQFSDVKKQPSIDETERQALETKNRVIADANNLDDDQFVQMYKMSKISAIHQVNQYDLENEKTKNAQKIAELEAKNELLAKYPNFAKQYEKVKAGIADLSVEARRNPEKLQRAMEKEFLLISKEEKDSSPAPKKETDMNRKRISNDFERPNPAPRIERKEDDLVPEEDRVLAARFGIHKESDRKKFSSNYIQMDMGRDMRDGKTIIFDGSRREPYKVGNS